MSIKEDSERASAKSHEGEFAAEQNLVPEGTILDPRVQIVIASMNSNLHRSILLSEMAEMANLSSSHLSHLFKTQTGLSPG
ncbi:MAG: AraC family transcriptional regulator, partial [Terriglobia bacterium]